jgi:hypothetical protein
MLLGAALIAGCGSSSRITTTTTGAVGGRPPEKGLLILGPGIRATAPPWPVANEGLAERITRFHLPLGGSEKFHLHALLSIYNQGLYVTVPGQIGLDPRDHVESSLHTHDPTGIVHMEAPKPFRYTLGDFFGEWGVRFGAGTLGGLRDDGKNRVWVYVNGKLITDPARHVMANDDNIAIGYGPQNSFTHKPNTSLLKEVESGGSALPCGSSKGKKKAKSCLASGA